MPIARRRYVVTFVAAAGLAVTWGLMLAFSWSAELGTVTLAPWVALLGFDLGFVGGAVAALGATGLWIAALEADNTPLDSAQLAVRYGALIVLGCGTALAGRRLRASEESQRGVASLQMALIDAALDGICLTDVNGEILISNRPLRRIEHRARDARGRHRARAAARDRGQDRGAGALPGTHARARRASRAAPPSTSSRSPAAAGSFAATRRR